MEEANLIHIHDVGSHAVLHIFESLKTADSVLENLGAGNLRQGNVTLTGGDELVAGHYQFFKAATVTTTGLQRRRVPDDFLADLTNLARALPSMEITDGCLRPPFGRQPLALFSPLYVRRCYYKLLEYILAAGPRSACVVTGTPGTGKSAFALFLLWHLSKSPCKITYRFMHTVLKECIILFDFTNPNSIMADAASEVTGDLGTMAAHQMAVDTWQLVDGAAPAGQWGQDGRMVIMTSPNDENYAQFSKSGKVHTILMRPWTLGGLERLRSRLYQHVSAGQLCDRFISFGGTVRYTLVKLEMEWSDFASSISLQDAAKLSQLDVASVSSGMRHRLAHIMVGPDLTKRYFILASPRIQCLVFQLALRQKQQNVEQLLLAAAGQSGVDALAGHFLEQLGHRLLPAGLTVRMRQLPQPMRKLGKRQAHQRTALSRAVRDRLEDAAGPSCAAASRAGTGLLAQAAAAESGTDSERGWTPDHIEVDAQHDAAEQAAEQEVDEQEKHDEEDQPATSTLATALGQNLTSLLLCEQDVVIEPATHCYDVPGLHVAATANCYLQPISAIQEAYDAVHVTPNRIMMLQYTYNSRHGVMAGALEKLLERLDPSGLKEVWLVFVVPERPAALFEEYSWQPYKGAAAGKGPSRTLKQVPEKLQHVQQWVMRLPLQREPPQHPDDSWSSSKGGAGSRGGSGGGA